MGIITLIVLLWLIGCFFPGSGRAYIDIGVVFANALTAIIGIGILYAYWGYSLAGILLLGDHFDWNGDLTLVLAIMVPIVGPMLIASLIPRPSRRRMKEMHP